MTPHVIENTHPVQVRVPVEIYEALRKEAYLQHLSVTQVVRTILSDWVVQLGNPPEHPRGTSGNEAVAPSPPGVIT